MYPQQPSLYGGSTTVLFQNSACWEASEAFVRPQRRLGSPQKAACQASEPLGRPQRPLVRPLRLLGRPQAIWEASRPVSRLPFWFPSLWACVGVPEQSVLGPENTDLGLDRGRQATVWAETLCGESCAPQDASRMPRLPKSLKINQKTLFSVIFSGPGPHRALFPPYFPVWCGALQGCAKR